MHGGNDLTNESKVNKRNVNPSNTYNTEALNFTHGVASGDPYPDSVILWTRCSPMQDDVADNSTVTGLKPLYNPVPVYRSDGRHTNASTAPVCVEWKITSDKALKNVADSGMVSACHKLHIERTGWKLTSACPVIHE